MTGPGFIVPAATLSVVPALPRALTNFSGNAGMAIVVARREGSLDLGCARP